MYLSMLVFFPLNKHYGKRKIYPYCWLKHFYLCDSEKRRRPGSLLAHRACIHWGALKDHPSKSILASLRASHLCCTQVLNPSSRHSCPARFTPDCSLNFEHPSPILPLPSLLSFRLCITRLRDGTRMHPRRKLYGAARPGIAHFTT